MSGNRSESASGGTDASVDPERVVARLRERGEEIRRREVKRARSQLTTRGELTERQRHVVEETADAIVESLLARPVEAARTAPDERTLQAIEQLFDADSQ